MIPVTENLAALCYEKPAIIMSGEKVLLETVVTDRITVKTSQFEASNYITYYEVKGGRVASLQRYTNELDAREGHLRWILKEWYKKSPQELICDA